jgi:hypothetical protein
MLPTATVFAQLKESNTFNIRVFGAQDTEAPTAPGSLAAVPVSPDQIDLSWLASHDNFVVSGYVVFRNGVPLATTTQLNYSDNGLVASTTYSYYVKAFDPSFNYSSSSNVAIATTPAAPIPPPPVSGHGTQSTATNVILNHLVITPGVSTSTFGIETKLPARFELRWGRTNSYELGYTVNDKYMMSYTTTVSDLEPGTTYEYELVGYTPQGFSTMLERGKFTTLTRGAAVTPSNVNHFQALANGTDVDLSWQLPRQETYQYIRIVRSYMGFPVSPSDGEVVYQGVAEHTTDSDILKQYSPVYYTAFVIDDAGNVSSGAVAKVYAGSDTVSPPTPGTQPVSNATATPSSDGFKPGETLTKDVRMPDPSEIIIIQNGVRNSFADENLKLDAYLPFTLSIPKQAVADNLKSIIVTLTDPTDSRMTSSFLLRINKDKTAYEAVVAPLEREGISRMLVDIYDYTAKVLGTYQKTIEFTGVYHTVSIPLFPDRIILFFREDWIPFVGGMMIGGLFFIIWRRRKAEDPA